MKEHIKISIEHANKFKFYIILIGVIGIAFNISSFELLTIAGFIISIMLEVILFSKLSNLITNCKQQNIKTILKENVGNYLIIILVLSIPVFCLEQVNNIFTFSMLNHIFLKISLAILIAIFSIYVLPIVFLKKVSAKALFVSGYYLTTNFKYSLPLVIFASISTLIKFSPLLIISTLQSINLYGIIPVITLASTLSVYISAIIFSAATLTLSENYAHEQKA